jgi:hypothetical protein
MGGNCWEQGAPAVVHREKAVMTVKARSEAAERAKRAMRRLEEHPDTSQNQLGAARDQLNIVPNFNDPHAVREAVHAIECIVLAVYDRIPAEDQH